MAHVNQRLRDLTSAQENLLKARDALDRIDLRRCTKVQREEIKAARASITTASTSVHGAIQGEKPRANA